MSGASMWDCRLIQARGRPRQPLRCPQTHQFSSCIFPTSRRAKCNNQVKNVPVSLSDVLDVLAQPSDPSRSIEAPLQARPGPFFPTKYGERLSPLTSRMIRSTITFRNLDPSTALLQEESIRADWKVIHGRWARESRIRVSITALQNQSSIRKSPRRYSRISVAPRVYKSSRVTT